MFLWPQVVAATLCGVCSHVFFFIHGEVFYQGPLIARIYLVTLVLLFLTEYKISSDDLRNAIFAAVSIAAAHVLSLLTSIIIYRTFFHRLKQFPGPKLARISKFYLAWKTSWSLDQCLFLEKLHNKYGDFVRTGPNEITIFTPDAINKLYGVSTGCTKASWWEMMWPEVSMITTRSKEGHALGRRAWEKGFSIKALRDYHPRMSELVDRFIKLLKTTSGKSINITEVFESYTIDSMGEIVFSMDFGMLRTGKPDPVIEMNKQGITLLGQFTPVPWLFLVIFGIPGLNREWLKFTRICSDKIQKRLRSEKAKSDILEYIINSDDKDKNPHSLLADFIAILAAGSDPVLCTLVYLFYHLALDPSQTSKLRNELASVRDISNDDELRTLRHLNGLINETMRLHPPVPSGGLRDTPLEGINIGDTYIPGSTTVVIPQYSLGRREDCYQDAHKFVPERWYSKPAMVRNKNAFMPFNIGNHTCLGQHLAKMEVRLAAARIVTCFDFGFAPGETGNLVEEKIVDAFVATPGPLEMVFTERIG